MIENKFFEHAMNTPLILKENYSRVKNAIWRVITKDLVNSVDKIVLFGSGDSFCVALGAVDSFIRIARIPAQAMVPLQASRYYAPFQTSEKSNRMLAVAISYSGEASRTIEAAAACAKAGFKTIALTAEQESSVAKCCSHVLSVPATPAIGLPCVHSYAVAQLAVYLMAVRFGLLDGSISEPEYYEHLKMLEVIPEVLIKTFNQNHDAFEIFASSCGKNKRIEFLSMGSLRASADFAVAKVIEATGYVSSSQDIEEFCHLNFFFNDPCHIPTVLIMTSEAMGIIRAREVFQILKQLGRPLFVFSDAGCLDDKDSIAITFDRRISESFAPLIFSCMLSAAISFMDVSDGWGYFRNHSGPYSENGSYSIKKSKIVV